MHCRTVLVPSLFFVIVKIVRLKKNVCIGHKICFMFLVNNQLDTQFFMYVYLHSLHVSGSHVPIIRRINVSM